MFNTCRLRASLAIDQYAHSLAANTVGLYTLRHFCGYLTLMQGDLLLWVIATQLCKISMTQKLADNLFIPNGQCLQLIQGVQCSWSMIISRAKEDGRVGQSTTL